MCKRRLPAGIDEKSPPKIWRAFSIETFPLASVLELGGEEFAVQAGPAPPFAKGRSGGIVNNSCVKRISPAAIEKPSRFSEGFFY